METGVSFPLFIAFLKKPSRKQQKVLYREKKKKKMLYREEKEAKSRRWYAP